MKGTAAFQCYPKDFLTDPNVMLMDLAEVGLYFKLLCLAWLDRGIPDDVSTLARLVGVSDQVFGTHWPRVRVCWTKHPKRSDRLINPRQERDRALYDSYTRKKVAAGKASGVSRRKQRELGKGTKSEHTIRKCSPKKRTKANSPTPTPTPTPSTENTIQPSIHSEGIAVPKGPGLDGCLDGGGGTQDRRAEIQKLTRKVATRKKAP